MKDAALVRADAVALPLADASVDLIVTSPPYFALRSYQDGGEHYDGQIGSEPTPQAFLEALWAVTAECARVLKPSGSIFVNLGDKYAGSGGHNNSGISDKSTLRGNGHVGGIGKAGPQKIKATLRSAPDRYNQNSGGTPAKSLMLLPERFRVGCVDRLGLLARAVLIWSKPNGLPESVTDRVRRSHEDWVHLTKLPRYFAAVDEVREPHLTPSNGLSWQERKAAGEPPSNRTIENLEANPHKFHLPLVNNPLGKLPGSVWTIPIDPLSVPERVGVDHFAAFPQEWPRRLILGWSPPDGIVLDPFAGTGTVPMVARALGRFGVGVDLSADYLRLARWRVFQSGHASKTRERTNREAQGGLPLDDAETFDGCPWCDDEGCVHCSLRPTETVAVGDVL